MIYILIIKFIYFLKLLHVRNYTMHAKIFSATTIGVDAHLVEVEVDISFGLVNFYIVGLHDTAIKESSKRILTSHLSRMRAFGSLPSASPLIWRQQI